MVYYLHDRVRYHIETSPLICRANERVKIGGKNNVLMSYNSERHSESSQISNMEHFAKIANGYKSKR